MQNQNNQFENYIFVDEVTIIVYDKPKYHLRLPSSYPKTIPSTSKFKSKLHIWAGISSKGSTKFAVNKFIRLISKKKNFNIKIFKQNMNSVLYRDILAEYLIPFAFENFDFDFMLHQDNDPKHTSSICNDFLKKNQIIWVFFSL